MSFRGRGRGGYRGGGGFGYARQEPFVEFPEIELPDPKAVKEERPLVIVNAKLFNFWKSSPCYLEESVSKKVQSMDIERFSCWGKSKAPEKIDVLGNFVQLGSMNFPKELVAGAKWEQSNPQKVRWNPSSDLQKFDLFEKLEEKYQGREEKGEKEKKEGGDKEEGEDEEAEEAEEEFSDDDYNQNIDFDDDDDDYDDMDDRNNDEPEY